MKKLFPTLICTILTANTFANQFKCDLTNSSILANGVSMKDLSCEDSTTRKVSVHVITADAKLVNFQPMGLSGPDDKKLKTLTKIADNSQLKSKIIAGINGGFFNMTTQGYKDDICPTKTDLNYGEGDSYLRINNVDWAKNCLSRPVVAFEKNLPPMIVPFLNPDESLGPIILDVIGGGPTLVIDKKINIDNYDQDKNKKYPWLNSRAARTAIGVNGNSVYLVNIEAKKGDYNTGMTIPELANFMLETLGSSSAMNLDGGGSSTMCKGSNCSILVNNPTDGKERVIHDGLFILKK